MPIRTSYHIFWWFTKHNRVINRYNSYLRIFTAKIYENIDKKSGEKVVKKFVKYEMKNKINDQLKSKIQSLPVPYTE